MKRIALIHTVGSVYASFETQLRSVLGEEVLIHNILDDFLATNPIEVGSFTETNVQRLRCDIQSAVLTGCDVVVTSCSTLSPAVERLKGEFSTPIITIDDAMANKAVETGSSLVVLATAHSTVEPTLEKLRRTAKEQGKAISVEAFVCTEAIAALRRGEKEEHDRLVLELSHKAKHAHVCVLAQASMAHMEEPIHQLLGIPVFSSPRLCMEQVAAFLKTLD